MCNCKQVEATFNKFEPVVNKPSDGDLYGYENIVKTSWDDDGLFDISVPSFSINILLDSDTNEFVGDLHIKHPKEENLGWNTITFKNKDYLLLCHRLLDRCYYECFARVLSNIPSKPYGCRGKTAINKICKILNGCGKKLHSKYSLVPNLIPKPFLIDFANKLINNKSMYCLDIKLFASDDGSSTSNIYAVHFEEQDDIKIGRVYHIADGSWKATLKGGFCYDSESKTNKRIYKSKLFGNANEFWNMLLDDKFKSTAEYNYFKEVIKTMIEHEETLSRCSAIYFSNDIIFIQNTLGNITEDDLTFSWISPLILNYPNAEVESEELSLMLANKLKALSPYQYYPLLATYVINTRINSRKEKEECSILDSLKTNNDVVYGNGVINVDEL